MLVFLIKSGDFIIFSNSAHAVGIKLNGAAVIQGTSALLQCIKTKKESASYSPFLMFTHASFNFVPYFACLANVIFFMRVNRYSMANFTYIL
jgi:hypothetical protein